MYVFIHKNLLVTPCWLWSNFGVLWKAKHQQRRGSIRYRVQSTEYKVQGLHEYLIPNT